MAITTKRHPLPVRGSSSSNGNIAIEITSSPDSEPLERPATWSRSIVKTNSPGGDDETGQFDTGFPTPTSSSPKRRLPPSKPKPTPKPNPKPKARPVVTKRLATLPETVVALSGSSDDEIADALQSGVKQNGRLNTKDAVTEAGWKAGLVTDDGSMGGTNGRSTEKGTVSRKFAAHLSPDSDRGDEDPLTTTTTTKGKPKATEQAREGADPVRRFLHGRQGPISVSGPGPGPPPPFPAPPAVLYLNSLLSPLRTASKTEEEMEMEVSNAMLHLDGVRLRSNRLLDGHHPRRRVEYLPPDRRLSSQGLDVPLPRKLPLDLDLPLPHRLPPLHPNPNLAPNPHPSLAKSRASLVPHERHDLEPLEISDDDDDDDKGMAAVDAMPLSLSQSQGATLSSSMDVCRASVVETSKAEVGVERVDSSSKSEEGGGKSKGKANPKPEARRAFPQLVEEEEEGDDGESLRRPLEAQLLLDVPPHLDLAHRLLASPPLLALARRTPIRLEIERRTPNDELDEDQLQAIANAMDAEVDADDQDASVGSGGLGRRDIRLMGRDVGRVEERDGGDAMTMDVDSPAPQPQAYDEDEDRPFPIDADLELGAEVGRRWLKVDAHRVYTQIEALDAGPQSLVVESSTPRSKVFLAASRRSARHPPQQFMPFA
ncbi:hypothetical protein FA13DRAFT_1716485 [Coprinellus micaceus]|uniref:Uncharacterized protein n=1 Tax=Coprinellus micaceus TaxID=71717 RepID=A0A4Y7SJU5_COPMI|nr:hypothetical protein FA13DRAFT_1716485 [Coprinellus micaceus]